MNPYRKYSFPNRNFPLGIVSMDTQGPTSLHEHDFEELVIITSGSGKHLYEGKEYDISIGDVYTIKPGMIHGYPKTKDLRLTNILFISSNLELETQDLSEISGFHVLFDLEPRYRTRTAFRSRLRLNLSQLNYLMSMVEQLKSELSGEKTGFRFMALTEFRRIIGYLSRIYSESPDKNTLSLIAISRTIQYMEANIAQPLSIPKLASLSNMSESTLLRTFKKSTGMTPVRYLVQLRIKNACELLRNNPDAISSVAYKSGYEDSNYFTRQFHQLMGMTPKEYRDFPV